jgi:hypothetical protein
MGAWEWLFLTVIASALIAIVVTYWVLDQELNRIHKRVLDVEREVHQKNLDSIIDRIERDAPHSSQAQTRVPPRR